MFLWFHNLCGPEGWAKPRKSGAQKGGSREGCGPEGWGPEGWDESAPNFALFFPSPATMFALFVLSLGVLLVEFWWCLKRRGPQMCTFGVLGLSCEAPAAPIGHDRTNTTLLKRGDNSDPCSITPTLRTTCRSVIARTKSSSSVVSSAVRACSILILEASVPGLERIPHLDSMVTTHLATLLRRTSS